jgi:two-component system sensor histidine kinase VicK
MFKSIQWRLVFIFVVVAIALVLPMGLVLNNRVEALYYERFIDGVGNGFRNWQLNDGTAVEEAVHYLRDEMNSIWLFTLDEYKSFTLIEKSSPNNILYSSDGVHYLNKGRFLTEILASRNLISVLNESLEGKDSGIVGVDERQYFDFARLVSFKKDGSAQDYVIYFRYNSDAWNSLTGGFSNAIMMSVLLAAGIAIASGYLLARTITDPIKKLMHSANLIADGDFDHVVDTRSDDEIGKLTLASNKMAQALKRNLEEITSEKNKQESILNCSQDGIVAYGLNGEVILSNPAATQMLGDALAHEPFDVFSGRFSMKRTISEISAAGEIVSWHLMAELGDKAFEIVCSVFSDIAGKPGGVIAVMHDVTEQQRLEAMRREFVADVSHELRTPLTSIISYTEALQDGVAQSGGALGGGAQSNEALGGGAQGNDALGGGALDLETGSRFLDVIHSEAERMARLVRELLLLSRFDSNQARWVFNRVDIAQEVRECVDRMQIVAQEKGQRLACRVYGRVPAIWADTDKLEQLLVNIVANAIKYTPERGKIEVIVVSAGRSVVIRVRDNGVGIPADDIPRLFERFFRVDKARSRELGGTGLGLSIAKEIVNGHHGMIDIYSEQGKGTEVVIRLPVQTPGVDADAAALTVGSAPAAASPFAANRML